jgi:hypothetical protein
LWLNRFERYFHGRHTPDNKRVVFAAFYLLRFHHKGLNGSRPTWPQFVQRVNVLFGPSLTDSSIG